MQHNTCRTRTLIQITGGKDDPHTVKSATKLTYMKNEKYRTVETVPKSNRHVVGLQAKLIALNIHVHDHSLSWLGIVTSIQSSGVNLVLLAQTSSLTN